MKLADNVNLSELSSKYEISGGGIMNVVRYATLMALKNKHDEIKIEDIKNGITKEFQKEGRTH